MAAAGRAADTVAQTGDMAAMTIAAPPLMTATRPADRAAAPRRATTTTKSRSDDPRLTASATTGPAGTDAVLGSSQDQLHDKQTQPDGQGHASGNQPRGKNRGARSRCANTQNGGLAFPDRYHGIGLEPVAFNWPHSRLP